MIELLAPAGDLEKLKVAIDYGADAVYFAGEIFGMRKAAKNFSVDQISEGVEYAHSRGKKVYMTLNIIPHNEDIDELQSYLETIKDLDIDAFIMADPGAMLMVKEMLGDVEIHLSTQANNTNALSAKFWQSQGVSRIVLARELSLEEIKDITAKNPEMEFEVFIHGAMCISYSGRCLISQYMTGRDANQGDCAQSCRWRYHLVEQSRPGEYYPIEESEKGVTFFNSKDLCGLPLLDQIIETGVTSLKIEGRNKSPFYVASVVRTYREALRRIEAGDFHYEDLQEELLKVSHRDYTQGFFEGKTTEEDQIYEDTSYVRQYTFIGQVLGYNEEKKEVHVQQRNHFAVGDEIEIFGPDYSQVTFTVKSIRNTKGEYQQTAPHPLQELWIPCDQKVSAGDMIRKVKE